MKLKKNQQKPILMDEIEKQNMINHHDYGKKLKKLFIKY
jgi:hypothetical protein